jgi:putative transposase
MARRKLPVIADQLLDQLLAGADAKTAFEKGGSVRSGARVGFIGT